MKKLRVGRAFFRKKFVILRPKYVQPLKTVSFIVTRLKIFLSVLFTVFVVSLKAGAASFTLVIDPGHGGNDPGAVGAVTTEKAINLNVALALGKLVEANCPGVKVIYTRKTDVFVPLQQRATIANKAKADLFISIHTNSAAKDAANAYGAETYTLGMHRAADNLEVAKRENSVITLEKNYKQVYQGFDPKQAESYIIFELMQDKHMAQSVKLADAIQKQYASSGRRNKGVHQAGFLVLRETSMPSVLTELGFISNPTEEAFLNSKEGVDKLARSIFDGFVSYRRQLAIGTNAGSITDAPQIASNAKANSEGHSADGATQEANDDNVPSIRPVKTIPYPTTPASTQPAPAPQPQPAAPKAEPAKTEKPKAEPAKQEPAKTEKPKAEPAKTEKPKTEPAKQEPAKTEKPKAEPAKTEPAKAEPAKQEKPQAPAAGKPEFRLQLFTSSTLRKDGDASFKGLSAEYYTDGDTYKYTYGKTTSYEEIVKKKAEVAEKFPGVFIIALLDGKRIDLQEAIRLSKEK